jgi:hypothetical protein
MKKNGFSNQVRIFIVVLFCIVLLLSSKSTMRVSAAVSTPKVSIVSLDHMPFLEGDANQFFIASNNYTGKVQYQFFYTCETTMGNKWKLINTSGMVNGWTSPSSAQEPVKVDISSLNLKADYYRFAIRVRRYGLKGTFSNSYGDYDYAYPFTLNVLKNSSVNLSGDMIINKNEFTEKQSLKIQGVKNSSANVSYKLHLYDVKNDKWITNLTEYGKTIDHTLNKLPEGPYIVDIWAKTDTSTNKYDGWKLSIINVKKETIPTVDLVSLDHQPFVEGDTNAFYVASKNYTGMVQYQFFYVCGATMGNKWQLINTAEMKDSWTNAVDANKPLRVDISSLKLKGEKYRFAIRVKRVGFSGTYKNQYGDYDNAYPFNLTVETQNSMKLNDEMLVDKDIFAKNDQLIVKGVKSATKDTQYKLHLYDVKNNKWLTNLTEYSSTIDYDLSNIPSGTYILDAWAKNQTSTNKYDGWKLKVINIDSNVLKVSGIENLQAKVKRYERYQMPKTIIALLQDGSKTSKPVTWDSEANTKKAAVYNTYGTVLGSDKKVKLTLTVDETFGNTNGNILNLGLVAKSGDYIYYSESGDLDRLYRAKSTGEETTKISDDSPAFINTFKGYIYYSNLSDNNCIYRIKLDGTERKKLTSTGFINTIVQDGWIYCTDDEKLNIYKISLDGSAVKKLNSEASLNLNITDDRIYYTNADDSLKIYRITKDGAYKTKVLNDAVGYISVEDDTIYYLNLDDEAKVYKVKTDGTGKTKLYDNPSGYLNLADNGRLYFLDFNANRVAYIDTLDNEKLYPLQNSGHLLNVIDEYVYNVYLETLGMFRTKNEGPEAIPFGRYYKSIDEVTLNAIKGAKIDLPLDVNVVTINDDKRTVSVKWDMENVDTSTSGKHIYKGSIIGSDIKAKATVNLLDIVEVIDSSFNISALVNEKIYFPNTTMATLSNGEKREVLIKWEASFIQKSEIGKFFYEGSIDGYAEKVKLTLTIDEVASVDFQDKNETLLRYSKVNLPLEVPVTTTSGRKVNSSVEWKYTGDISSAPMIVTNYYKTVNTDFLGTHNFEGTVIGYNQSLKYTINLFENINLPAGEVVGKYDGYTLFYANNKIYTINPEGTAQKLIAEDVNLWPNPTLHRVIYYNGWVYYLGKGRGAANPSDIYKMKLDGSERTLINTVQPNNYSAANVQITNFRIANDCIYYSAADTLYIVKLEGTTMLSKLSITYPYDIKVTEENIYYSGVFENSYVTMKAKKDGSSPTVFIKNTFVDVVGDYIYYIEGNKLARMKLDGSSKLIYDNVPYPYRKITIQEDCIYYSTGTGICKINTDGTANTILDKGSEYGSNYLHLFDGFIYFDGDFSGDWIWRVKTDGTGKEIVGKQH